MRMPHCRFSDYFSGEFSFPLPWCLDKLAMTTVVWRSAVEIRNSRATDDRERSFYLLTGESVVNMHRYGVGKWTSRDAVTEQFLSTGFFNDCFPVGYRTCARIAGWVLAWNISFHSLLLGSIGSQLLLSVVCVPACLLAPLTGDWPCS